MAKRLAWLVKSDFCHLFEASGRPHYSAQAQSMDNTREENTTQIFLYSSNGIRTTYSDFSVLS